MKHILSEITPLDRNSLFYVSYYSGHWNDFPLHFHEDYELALTLDCRGQLIVGNYVGEFPPLSLVIKGPNVQHSYKIDETTPEKDRQLVVVQFRKNFHHSDLFNTVELQPIREMLQKAETGILFSEELTLRMRDRILALGALQGFARVTAILDVLNELAVQTAHQTVIASSSVESRSGNLMQQSKRINKILNFVEINFRNRISLRDIGTLIGMPPSSACRFFKTKTNQRFWDYLNDYRVDRAAQMIVDTSRSISEICFECGFNNISNFNRAFRRRKMTTPSEYRKKFQQYLVPNPQMSNVLDRLGQA